MLTGVHILLTYQCTTECDHCFLHCGPQREGTFTLRQLRELLHEIKKIHTIDTVYFEGGEPFLFRSVRSLLSALRATARGDLYPPPTSRTPARDQEDSLNRHGLLRRRRAIPVLRGSAGRAADGARRGFASWHRDQRILGELAGGCGAMAASLARLGHC